MPTSHLAVIPHLLANVHGIAAEVGRPIRVLDVGPGFGKYGLLIREYVDGVPMRAKVERLDAVEAEVRYVMAFRWLEHVYDEVIIADVTDLDAYRLREYDLVIMADVIEHLEKDRAGELLDRIPGYVIVSTPRDYFQNPEAHKYPTENHRSHWVRADFEARGALVDGELLDTLGCLFAIIRPL